jgi:hypothetical protein
LTYKKVFVIQFEKRKEDVVMVIPRLEDFVKEIETLKMEARECGDSSIEICSGTPHKMLGDRKGKNARMASCCRAMYKSMKSGDEVIQLPNPKAGNTGTKGFGSRLIIRYYL